MLGGLAWQVTLAEFMEQCAKVDKTTTSDGYSSLLEDYSNTKFFVFGSFSPSSSLLHLSTIIRWLRSFGTYSNTKFHISLPNFKAPHKTLFRSITMFCGIDKIP
jgi:hypothetical protein